MVVRQNNINDHCCRDEGGLAYCPIAQVKGLSGRRTATPKPEKKMVGKKKVSREEKERTSIPPSLLVESVLQKGKI